MIKPKYQKIYDEFIKKYEEIHLDPWHEISKEELQEICDKLTSEMDIVDEYTFTYFILHIIKRISGKTDAHTSVHQKLSMIPMNFRVFDEDILVNYPEYMRGYKLLSINDIPIIKIIDELDEIITYGTEGWRRKSLENTLFNKTKMLSIPSLRKSEILEYKIQDLEGNIITKKFKKDEEYDDLFDLEQFFFGDYATYYFRDNCLVYNHTSVSLNFEEKIKESIDNLSKEDFSGIDTIIINIRGNTGGHSKLNNYLTDFLKKHKDKKLICLTDYRVFSGGRYALRDLVELGATTIGEEIGTPTNCFGNKKSFTIDNLIFSVAKSYNHPFMHIGVSSKENYNKEVTEDLKKLQIFKPDILVNENEEDYINGIDTILEYAIKYSHNKKLSNEALKNKL